KADAKPGDSKAGEAKPGEAKPEAKGENNRAERKDGPDVKQQAAVKALAEALGKAQAEAQLAGVVKAAQQVQAAQKIQLQLQGQPVQVQLFPAQGGGGAFVPMGESGVGTSGQITLMPGTHKSDQASYAGAVRVRVLPTPETLKKQGDKEGQYI